MQHTKHHSMLSNMNEGIDYEKGGYQLIKTRIGDIESTKLIISREFMKPNSDQPDCPLCSYQFKPYWKNAKQIKPNNEYCPLCGFDFYFYRECNFQIGLYFKRRNETPPTLFLPHVDKALYNAIYKKFCFK